MPSGVSLSPPCRASRRPLQPPSRRAALLSAAWCSLLALSTGCAQQPASSTLPVIPAALDRPCLPGPALPDGAVSVADLLEILAQREAASRECRARVQGLRAAWPR